MERMSGYAPVRMLPGCAPAIVVQPTRLKLVVEPVRRNKRMLVTALVGLAMWALLIFGVGRLTEGDHPAQVVAPVTVTSVVYLPEMRVPVVATPPGLPSCTSACGRVMIPVP